MEKVELNFKRNKELFDQKLVSREVFDNTQNELDSSRNAVEIARNNLERSQKQLQLVEDKLAKTKITAPFDCTILTRPVSMGQAVSGASGVNSGTEVLTIADLSELIINAHINQADVTRMTVGQNVQIEVEAVAGLKLFGRLDRIAPQATIRNGIKGFATRIVVKNDENSGLRPGMTANLTIPLQSAENVLAVPLAAVFTDQGNRFAYVKQGEKFARVPIVIGVSDYDFAEVTRGLQGGETVSLVTPADEAGQAQQAFGAAAKGSKQGGKPPESPGGKPPGGGGPRPGPPI
jgi:HlyD family secretion protein